jgi:predicted short-subunit dehydrogenase-like oxidoreductase (DUF2520 family)
MYQNSISFAGAGKVAGGLCKVLHHAGFAIDVIVSQTMASGKSLAGSCNAVWSPDLLFPDSTRIIIVAVPDHRLIDVLNEIRCRPGTLVAHTAGSFGLDIFPERFKQKGVFYPLQTFSKNRNVNFDDLPFLLECSDNESSEILKTLAEAIGGKVHFIETEQRRMIHLAAIFACNFTNHMLTLGKELASKAELSFEFLTPLIKETIAKALECGPENSQTGPAVRHDKNTIEKHLELLSFSQDFRKVYNDMTESIIKYYKTSGG